MPPRGAPSLRFSADGPRHLADQIAEQLHKETAEQVAQTPEAEGIAVSGRSASAPRPVIYGPDGTPRSRPRVEDFLDMIMRREGGYADNPKDPGGRTNFGVTQRTLDGWHSDQVRQFNEEQAGKDTPWKVFEPTRLPGVPSIPMDVKDLTKEQARALHKNLVWDKYGLGQIKDDNAAYHLFDMLTMSGPVGVSKIVYPAIDAVMKNDELYDHGETPLAMPEDGGVDQHAIDRMNWLIDIGHARDLQEALVNQRLAYVQKLRSYKDFRGGWVPRIEWFRPRSTPPEGWYR
jgi:lysozyme family protein